MNKAEKAALAAAKKKAALAAKKKAALGNSYTFTADTEINIGSTLTHILPAGLVVELNENGTYGDMEIPAEYLPE